MRQGILADLMMLHLVVELEVAEPGIEKANLVVVEEEEFVKMMKYAEFL